MTEADNAFETSKRRYVREIYCKKGCYDCCYIGAFSFYLIETLYLYENYKKLIKSLRRMVEGNVTMAWEKISASGVLAGLEYSSGKWKELIEKVAKLRILCPLVIDGSVPCINRGPLFVDFMALP